MKAIVRDAYGPPDILKLEQIERPVPAEDEVLLRVRPQRAGVCTRRGRGPSGTGRRGAVDGWHRRSCSSVSSARTLSGARSVGASCVFTRSSAVPGRPATCCAASPNPTKACFRQPAQGPRRASSTPNAPPPTAPRSPLLEGALLFLSKEPSYFSFPLAGCRSRRGALWRPLSGPLRNSSAHPGSIPSRKPRPPSWSPGLPATRRPSRRWCRSRGPSSRCSCR